MDIAILAATEREMQPVEKAIGERLHSLRHHGFRFVVTGVGLMHSTHTMTRAFAAHRPDLAIQVGIAGAFDTKVHAPGSTVVVRAETLGDVGASETDGTWKDLFDLGLEGPGHRRKHRVPLGRLGRYRQRERNADMPREDGGVAGERPLRLGRQRLRQQRTGGTGGI